jgi:serine/threonine-protein kinase
MAPEQVDPNSPGVDARTDVYALGLILYEMLVGEVPFRREGLTGMLQEVLGGNPMSPRKVKGEVPEELDRICCRATERSPDRRYPSAAAMAQALEHFLESSPAGGHRESGP